MTTKKTKQTPAIAEAESKPMTITEALVRFSLTFKGVAKERTNTYTDSKYASLDDVMRAIKKPLFDCGLMVVQSIDVDVIAEKAEQILTTHIALISQPEDFIASKIILQQERATPQGFGSSLTYMRRYSVCTLLNIVETADDDGNAAEKTTKPKDPNFMPIESKQLASIKSLMSQSNTSMAQIMGFVKSTGADSLEVMSYGTAVKAIRTLEGKVNGSV